MRGAVNFLEIHHQQAAIFFRHTLQEPVTFIEALTGEIHLSG